MRRRLQWPFDFASSIALFALLLSVVQFLVTTPMIVDYYIKPELVISGKGANPQADVLIGMFQLKNEGRASATNIEIGIDLLQEDQRLSLSPNIDASIVEDENPILVKNARVSIPKLAAGESVLVFAFSGPNNEKLRPDIAESLLRGGIREIPFVSFIKSDQGLGRNETSPVDPVVLEKIKSDSDQRVKSD